MLRGIKLPRVKLISNILLILSTNKQLLPTSLPSIDILHPVNAELSISIGILINTLGFTPRGSVS